MLILGLDLAVRSGFALGRPGTVPRSGVVRLKRPQEDWEVAPGNLGCFLRDMFFLKSERPELCVYEAPLPFFASHADQRQRSIESLVLPPALVGALLAICGTYGIPTAGYQANTIRKTFIGKANMGDRTQTKQAVIKQCHVEKLMPPDCKDDNRADGIATWMYGCRKHAGYTDSNVVMFAAG